MKKIHINEFISQVTNSELMKAVENSLAIQKVHTRTVTDDLVEFYFEPLMGPGFSTVSVSEDFVFREISKRLFNTPHLKKEFELINI